MRIWLPWALLTGLTAWVAWVDARDHRIPNLASLVAAGLGLGLMIAGILPWTHLFWAAGVGGLLEAADLLEPGRLGSGDIKWAVIVMGWLGPVGLGVIAAAQLVALLWGTVAWVGHHRSTRWAQAQAPWGPGFLAGLLMLASVWWLING